MKLFLLPFATVLLFSIPLFAQTNVQVGAAGVFSKTTGKGMEINGNLKTGKNFSIGLGVQPMKFEGHSKWYVPVYSSFKYYYPLKKSMLFANVDPGYGIYPLETYFDGIANDNQRKGTIYLSAGVGVAGKSPLAPYAAVHFTKFGFSEYHGTYRIYRPISTLTFSAGIMLNW